MIYFIQYKYKHSTDLITLDLWNKRRILSKLPFHNNRPLKKFTPKLLEKLEIYTFYNSSVIYFTKALQDNICWDTEVNMSTLMGIIKTWEKMISTSEIKKITKLHIIH